MRWAWRQQRRGHGHKDAGDQDHFMVSLAVLVLRVKDKARARPFKTPLVWVVAAFDLAERGDNDQERLGERCAGVAK